MAKPSLKKNPADKTDLVEQELRFKKVSSILFISQSPTYFTPPTQKLRPHMNDKISSYTQVTPASTGG